MTRTHEIQDYARSMSSDRPGAQREPDLLRSPLRANRKGAAVLLAAGVSAMLVAADQVLERFIGGNEFAEWFLLWSVGFAALITLATPARRLVTTFRNAVNARVRRRLCEDELSELLQAGISDPRIMEEILRATGGSEAALIAASRFDLRWPALQCGSGV